MDSLGNIGEEEEEELRSDDENEEVVEYEFEKCYSD